MTLNYCVLGITGQVRAQPSRTTAPNPQPHRRKEIGHRAMLALAIIGGIGLGLASLFWWALPCFLAFYIYLAAVSFFYT